MRLGRNLATRLEGRQSSLVERILYGDNRSNNITHRLPTQMCAPRDPLYESLRGVFRPLVSAIEQELTSGWVR